MGTVADLIVAPLKEAAAFAASAEARPAGTRAVRAGSCGPGDRHLIDGFSDVHRTRAPVSRRSGLFR